MNRFQLTILSIILTFLSVKVTFSQNTLIKKDWLAVKCEPLIKGNGISPINGFIFTFTDDKMYWRNVYSDKTIDFNYILKGEIIEIDDTARMEINFVSKDSLKLVFDKIMVTTFIPLDENYLGITLSANDLFENNWIYKTTEFQQRIDFLENNWTITKNDIAKKCITHVKGDKYCYQEMEKWSLNSIKNFTLFSFTIGQFDSYTHQVIKQNGDTIFTKLWNGKKFIYPILFKEKKLERDKRNELIKKITSKEWYSIEVISASTSFDEDTVGFEFEETGFFVIDTTLMDKNELLKNKMKFYFTDSKYDIITSNKVFVTGKWKLSIDGKYIILNDGLNTNDYIELIEVNDKNLVIGKSDKFSVGKKRDFIEYFYRLKLK